MSEKKLENVCGNGPLIKTRSGRFQVGIWHWKRLVGAKGEMRDFAAERQQDIYRASIRCSEWNRQTRTWQDQTIWCSVDDLRSLVQVLDELNIPESDAPVLTNTREPSPVSPSAIEG